MAALSPAESLFLLKPNRTPPRETVKVTLLSPQGDEARLTRLFGLTANRLPPASRREMIPLDQ
jgi:hypothetical protein